MAAYPIQVSTFPTGYIYSCSFLVMFCLAIKRLLKLILYVHELQIFVKCLVQCILRLSMSSLNLFPVSINVCNMLKSTYNF